MRIQHPNISPYILAGGKSSRMGRDKRLLKHGGMTLLERTCLLAETTTGRRPILTGDNLATVRYSGYTMLADAMSDKGPLGGIVSALRDCRTDWALILPVDMPGLTEEILESMFRLISHEVDVVTLGSSGFIEPLVAVYRVVALPFWEDRLLRNELSPVKGIKKLKHRILNVRSPQSVLINLNRPEDIRL